MLHRGRILSMVALVVGVSCGKHDDAARTNASGATATGSARTAQAGSGAETPTPAAGSSAAGSDAAAAVRAATLEAATGRYGILLADTPGGGVILRSEGGKTQPLADLTIVTVVGEGTGASMLVDVAGQRGQVKNTQIVYGDDIQRSPKGDFAIVTPLIECEDVCTSAVWLVHGTAQRWRALDSAVHAIAAWHPRGTNVAIGGSGQLVVRALPSGDVLSEINGYMAPAYSPDGTLYVRDDDFGVFTFIDGKATKVGKGTKPKPREGEFAIDPKPVAFGADGTFKTVD